MGLLFRVITILFSRLITLLGSRLINKRELFNEADISALEESRRVIRTFITSPSDFDDENIYEALEAYQVSFRILTLILLGELYE